MAEVAAIEAKFTLDDSDFRNKLENAPKVAQDAMSKGGGILSQAVGTAIGTMAASYVQKAIGGAIGFVKSSMKAFMEQDEASRSLRASLRNIGEEYNLQSQALEKYAGDLQKVTRYGDETTVKAMSMGINMGISAGKIKDATKAAMGLAAAYGMDLNTSMQLVAKASQGNAGALSRYGITVDATKSRHEQFNQVLKKGIANFELAKESAKTLAGQLGQAAGAYGDLQETIGQCIVEMFNLDEAGGSIADMLSELNEKIQEHKDEWIFSIKQVYYFLEAGVKAVWETAKPVVMLVVDIFKTGFKNIYSIIEWTFENAGKIVRNFPDIIMGVMNDIVNYIWNRLKMLLDVFVNFWSAVWRAIRHGEIEGFSEMLETWKEDALTLYSDIGEETKAAMKRAGVTELHIESPDYSKVIDDYKGLGDRLVEIDRTRQKKQEKEEERYQRRLREKNMAMQDKSKKRNAMGPDEAVVKMNVMGSFSAAVLDAMLGASTPEKETAKNTRKAADYLFQIREATRGSNVYA